MKGASAPFEPCWLVWGVYISRVYINFIIDILDTFCVFYVYGMKGVPVPFEPLTVCIWELAHRTEFKRMYTPTIRARFQRRLLRLCY